MQNVSPAIKYLVNCLIAPLVPSLFSFLSDLLFLFPQQTVLFSVLSLAEMELTVFTAAHMELHFIFAINKSVDNTPEF